MIKGLKYTLEQDGYETVSAYDGEEALALFAREPFDLVLLDVMLPRMDGIQVCQRIREVSTVPIIMLTAKGEDLDKILGLEYGADDYISKPFNILEVKARIKSILRRVQATSGAEDQRLVRVRDLEVNTANRSVTLRGKEVRLTAEFNRYSCSSINAAAPSREEMLTCLKNDCRDACTVDVHIRRLRADRASHPAGVYLHQVGSGLLFHRSRRLSPSPAYAGRC